MIEFDSRIVLGSSTIIQQVDDEVILLDLSTSQYYLLNPTGARILQAISQPQSLQQAFDELSGEFDVTPGVLETDMRELVEELVRHHLVTIA